MPRGFHASPGAQAEVNRLMQVEVDRFRQDVLRRARKSYKSDFGLGDTGRTFNSIKDYGPGGLTIVIGTGNHKGAQMKPGVDVGLVLHQGHIKIRPVTKKALAFTPKGGTLVIRKSVRAVGESPFLTSALIGAARSGTVQWKVRNIKRGVRAPGPHRI